MVVHNHLHLPSLLFVLWMYIPAIESQTCQCLPSGAQSQACFGYDSKFQADTLDDAIAFFPDLSLDQKDSNEPVDIECKTEYCQNCKREMRAQLVKVGLLITDNDPMDNTILTNSTCHRYSFSMGENKSEKVELNKSESSESRETEVDDSLSNELGPESFAGCGLSSPTCNPKPQSSERKKKKKRRDKRSLNTGETNASYVGTRFEISCSRKGVSVDPTGTVSLCSYCWVWRQLPNNYRPRYVNELICDTSDASCLSGYAKCAIGLRTFEAMRNESGINTLVTLTAGSYCECRIPTSSSLQSLVRGDGISGTYTPILNSTGNSI